LGMEEIRYRMFGIGSSGRYFLCREKILVGNA